MDLEKSKTIYFSGRTILRGDKVYMHGDIVFYTHGSTIEYGGEIFTAGELIADILNFAPEDYRPIQRLLNRMKDLSKQYENTLVRGVWWELNNQMIELRSQLIRSVLGLLPASITACGKQNTATCAITQKKRTPHWRAWANWLWRSAFGPMINQIWVLNLSSLWLMNFRTGCASVRKRLAPFLSNSRFLNTMAAESRHYL